MDDPDDWQAGQGSDGLIERLAADRMRRLSRRAEATDVVAEVGAAAVQNHPSSTVQKFHHRHGRSTNGDCVKALPNVSEALDRRVGIGRAMRNRRC